MTRPHIIRADTLDLQSQDQPSAQDHTRQPAHPAPLGIGPAGPHQSAAVKHVQQERVAEEGNLEKAWSDAGHELSEEPASDDENTHAHANGKQRDESATQQNGGFSGEDSDMADAESDENMDDDMMDKISSSPSIEDGGYSYSLSTDNLKSRNRLPQLQVTSPTSPHFSPRSINTNSSNSSPYTTTTPQQQHLPVPQGSRSSDTRSSPSSDSSSPYSLTPIHLPLIFFRKKSAMDAKSTSHHQDGEYRTRSPIASDESPTDEGYDDGDDYDSQTNAELDHIIQLQQRAEDRPDLGEWPLTSSAHRTSWGPRARNRPPGSMEDLSVLISPAGLERSPSRMLIERPKTSPDVEEFLLPEDDPLLKEEEAKLRGGTTPMSPAASDDSWSTLDSDDDSDDLSFPDDFPDDGRFVDSGFGGECLRHPEDIDFEFVYALHTFVATVEGQANATKGDTMVLLDDSNSYWWLVRIVKDATIGYLPAEHIETPTERLARLNKHRNIDLSATMLGDTSEKTKNPLKKAMRRRNAKTVTFSPPTYVEASDVEYSTDEEDEESEDAFANGANHGQDGQEVQEMDQDEISSADPSGAKDSSPERKSIGDDDSRRNGVDGPRQSDESFDRKSRNGTVRNTDSFFKDDNVETIKKTLTPNILRDDSSGSTARSQDSRERGTSIDSMEKQLSADKPRDDKKRKEKKPGMLSGLFKRKDKKYRDGPHVFSRKW
ncbi:hypothetical protein K402DRAFT_195929 [Aulographum hederae CBS 113979]|uniref:SH3 domain-containing protein n=1 Tax=Aulographum hederae CBS 113979 TaxID=1176131 RepID=A0A6G1GNT1_9PEZI|nr:hypothetical protein K402DRAFT_195929 [Aulographum hederae CBS 113979]